MMPSPLPLLHGSLGWWDEILCLVPTVLLVLLAYYIYRSDRKHEDQAETQAEIGSDESEQ